MSFTFGFSGDDIEEEDEDEKEDNDDGQDNLVHEISKYAISERVPLIPPKRHSLKDLLASVPSQLWYNSLVICANHDVPGGNSPTAQLVVQRRALFDIRVQLMAEANPEENNHDKILAGLESGDLTAGVYEGGFKTWECALDLASHAAAGVDFNKDWHVVELGAGSAVPSLAILQLAMQARKSGSKGRLTLTLCDYNEDVLRLGTAPNVFLNYLTASGRVPRPESLDDQELDLEAPFGADIVQKTMEDMATQNISFCLVSGSWGDDFLHLLSPPESGGHGPPNLLILASETIYSPASIKVFAEVVISLLKRHGKNGKAWVAAKKVYFGVGGGVDEFRKEIKDRQGDITVVAEITSTGVGRVVLEVTLDTEASDTLF